MKIIYMATIAFLLLAAIAASDPSGCPDFPPSGDDSEFMTNHCEDYMNLGACIRCCSDMHDGCWDYCQTPSGYGQCNWCYSDCTEAAERCFDNACNDTCGPFGCDGNHNPCGVWGCGDCGPFGCVPSDPPLSGGGIISDVYASEHSCIESTPRASKGDK